MVAWEKLPKEMQNDTVKVYYDLLKKRKVSLALKRCFDIFIATIITLVLLIPMLVISVAIKLDSKGSVIFKQERITTYYKKFYIYKFRTMVSNAEQLGTQITVSDDNRITKVGKVLRKFHLDEIPQLFNILKGEMSFVGTRPEVERYVKVYTDEMLATLLLPAGVTSLASIKYKDEFELISSAEDCDDIYINKVLPDKMKYNVQALKNFNILFDIGIMFKTFFSVFVKEAEDTAKNDTKKALIIAEDARSLILTRKELLLSIMDAGISIDTFLPYDDYCEELKAMGIKVIDVPFDRRSTNPFNDIKLFFTYKKLIKEKYDFGITYSIKPNIYGGIAMRKKSIPYYINVTGTGSAFYKGGLLKSIIEILYLPSSRHAGGLFFENSHDRDTFVEARLCKKEKTYVLNGAGINTSEFLPENYPNNHIKKILYIGRLMEEKGIEDLYPVIKDCNDKNKDVVFEFLGEFEDTYKESFEKFLQLKNVIYYGYQNNVRDYIKNCNCLILPSYHEGMANVLLEAAALGRPLLASDIPGCREAVMDGVSGYLFKAGDGVDIKEKVNLFLSLEYNQMEKMGKESRKHIEDNFERKDVVNNALGVIGVKTEIGKSNKTGHGRNTVRV